MKILVVDDEGIALIVAKPFTPDELLDAVLLCTRKEEGHGKKESAGNR